MTDAQFVGLIIFLLVLAAGLALLFLVRGAERKEREDTTWDGWWWPVDWDDLA